MKGGSRDDQAKTSAIRTTLVALEFGESAGTAEFTQFDDGYVVTDPPPVADSASADDNGDDSGSGGTADVYIYPRNGQSDEQTANDRYECHKWAVGQTGFDPTRSSQASGTASEYRRAMIACLGARGYSAK